MVIIEKMRELEGDSGNFVVLDLVSAEPTIRISQTTGRPYMTLMRCSISCTFSREIAEKLVGTKLPGRIQKVEVDAYHYTNPSTGEVKILNHSYRFVPEATMEEAVFSN